MKLNLKIHLFQKLELCHIMSFFLSKLFFCRWRSPSFFCFKSAIINTFKDDLLFIYEISAKTLLNVLLKYHEPANVASRPTDTEFLTNMVIQFANQFVCQVDLQLKLVTRQIKFIDIICKVIECRLEKSTLDDTLKRGFGTSRFEMRSKFELKNVWG